MIRAALRHFEGIYDAPAVRRRDLQDGGRRTTVVVMWHIYIYINYQISCEIIYIYMLAIQTKQNILHFLN
jgi:hypothetical protein